ncbi:DUF308 domain-containing protein [Vagococcus sp. BWB3-3]|uniref:DUF308 domain-containing protein n=1 Tax=Vagococcus allomyrinae TaxID=2794353 RepID=A0A940PA19_9ENTE|nr:DUF308 domain-containing protein [Vagococcus allomyrinae]MBP1039606.1 DUF308 domain-containing protein [Vagococcus allomyrinae]
MRKEKNKFLLQGIVLLILGLLFISNPIQQGVIFLMILGGLFTVIGIAAIIDGLFMTKGIKYKILRSLEGVLVAAFGLIFFLRNPASGATLIINFVVIMMIVLAISNTLAIFKSTNGLKWLAIALNILVIWFGVQSLFDPQLAIVIFYWTVSFQLFFTGINHIMMYFLVSNLKD